MSSSPWESYPELWKNSTAFFTYLRGCLRRAWNKSPVKIMFIQKRRKRIEGKGVKGKVREIWGAECNICKKDFPLKDIQVDHVHPAGKLNGVEDIEQFVVNLLFIGEGDLQLLCKPCHTNKSHAEKKGISFEEAAAEKQAIAICKEGVSKQKEWLNSRSILPASSVAGRRQQIKEVLSNELSRGT